MSAGDYYLETILGDLFTKTVFLGNRDACFLQGQAAGDQAYPRRANPYSNYTVEREWWDGGWCLSQDELCGT